MGHDDDTDEKKTNMYRARLSIHLQECMVQLTSLSYNELASVAIDQERMMKAIAEVYEKRKKMMSGSTSSGSSSGAPPKYHTVYTPPGGQLHRPQ
jgi:4-diphosphocytidyl-2C-methyl-D-erythritol kinase